MRENFSLFETELCCACSRGYYELIPILARRILSPTKFDRIFLWEYSNHWWSQIRELIPWRVKRAPYSHWYNSLLIFPQLDGTFFVSLHEYRNMSRKRKIQRKSMRNIDRRGHSLARWEYDNSLSQPIRSGIPPQPKLYASTIKQISHCCALYLVKISSFQEIERTDRLEFFVLYELKRRKPPRH